MPPRRVKAFPHEFSGGMRQRAMIAMAISNNPRLIIADEPTTALDVTIQAQILEVLEEAKRITGAAVSLITHDLGVVAGHADRVAVMYAGKLVELGDVDQIFHEPTMPYTIGLLRSVPNIRTAGTERLVPLEGRPPSLARSAGRMPVRGALPGRDPEVHAGRAGARSARSRPGAHQRVPPRRRDRCRHPHRARDLPAPRAAGARRARRTARPCSRSRTWSSTSR